MHQPTQDHGETETPRTVTRPDFHRSVWQVLALVVVAIGVVAVGDTLMRAALEHSGPIWLGSPPGDLHELHLMVANWRLILGVALHVVYFGLYAVALSWAPLSFIEPLTAGSYVIVIVLAHFYLQESVPLLRWAGSLLVVAGLVLIGRSAGHIRTDDHYLERPGEIANAALGDGDGADRVRHPSLQRRRRR